MNGKNDKSHVYLGDGLTNTCYFLTMLFCTLRACDVISWKWYWIMAPVFISAGIGIVLAIIMLIISIAWSRSLKKKSDSK